MSCRKRVRPFAPYSEMYAVLTLVIMISDCLMAFLHNNACRRPFHRVYLYLSRHVEGKPSFSVVLSLDRMIYGKILGHTSVLKQAEDSHAIIFS